MAIKTMAEIMAAVHGRPSASETSLIRCAIYHRLGTVPVGDPSIVIAVSSPHRQEAFIACENILEEVKLKAQIWKREYYEGGREEDAEWKANK
jgi:molybdopterin synthase catalytic subunit